MNVLHDAHDWCNARQRRERIMLGTMFAMLAAFMLWYGLVTPIRWIGEVARQHYDEAANTAVTVQADLRQLALMRERRPNAPHAEQAVAMILSTADTAGVAINRQHVDDDGVMHVGIDVIETTALLGWLDQMQRSHGLSPQTLEIGKRNGALRVDVAFSVDGA